jgi:glycosyltransferase involved in cell wall biosynthesis
LLYNVTALIETLNFHLATKLVAYTPSIVETLHFDRYRHKILTIGARYVDTNEFAPTTAITDRKDVIGYVGRLSREKGVLNLIQAMPEIVHERPAVQLCIIGEGPLHDAARRMTQENGLIERVRFLGEVPHHRIPTCLNEMKLLVIPSYTEGLPTILLEAMACGTPVLATPVGNIPDIIDDGENGFIVPANSPSILAAAIVAALSNDTLGDISNHAAESVAAHYSFEASVARHREIIKSLE